MTTFERFPGLKSVQWSFSGDGWTLTAEAGLAASFSAVLITDLMLDWINADGTDDSIETLRDLNREEAGAPLCEYCQEFHPDLRPANIRTAYVDGEQPQPVLCPRCLADWNAEWDERWEEYYRGLL